jgi:hypothetical protein
LCQPVGISVEEEQRVYVITKFSDLMRQEYRESDESFLEKEGRLVFLSFFKPIINGTGFYYVEPRTRNNRRMDLIVTYGKEEFIVELKIWRGERYNAAGEKQICEYLDYWRLQTGYMLSFNFCKKKECGVHQVMIGDKLLYEGTV